MTVTAVPDSRISPDGAVAIEHIHDSAIASVLLYRCLCEGEYLRGERCHHDHVLAVGLDGSCEVHDGRRSHFIDPVTALLHRPGSTYRTTHPHGCNDSGLKIAYREDVAEEAYQAARFRMGTPKLTITARPMRPALQQMVLVLRLRRGLPVDPVAMDEIVMEMLGSALGLSPAASSVPRKRTRDEHRRIVDAAREYLNENLRETIRLDDVAREVGASPFHLSRVFRRETGLPLRAYLHYLRLGAVVHALTGTDRPITRIALDSGFSSHSHLTSTFMREMGVPPSHVRTLLGRRADVQDSPLFAAGKFPSRR